MNLKEVDLIKLSKLTSQHIDHITCLECCKYYIAPETADCGHTLCHFCWRKRRTCPSCAKPFERRNLRHNQPVQTLTEHVCSLGEAFEKLFNIKLDDFLLDTGEMESENDPTKNVKEWLADSQNQFSAPVKSSEQYFQEPEQNLNSLEITPDKIQIHAKTSKTKNPEKVAHVAVPQDDWDKIEQVPDSEVINTNKQNVVGPMDIEPFYTDENEYTLSNPRRSSRKRELKPNNSNDKTTVNNSLEKQSSKDSSREIDKKSNNTKQNWKNVKRMRQEFSKLNKKNKNKLNVSIEMCKKTQNTTKVNVIPQAPSPQVYDIDENTPDNFNVKNQTITETPYISPPVDRATKANASTSNNANINKDNKKVNSVVTCPNKHNIAECENINHMLVTGPANNSQSTNAEIMSQPKFTETAKNKVTETEKTDVIRMPFYKRSALYPHNEANTVKTITHNVDTNTPANDDIEITIKVGNTITNIIIKKKNDVDLKVNADRAIQTSLGLHNIENNIQRSLINTKTQNILINVGENDNINVDHGLQSHPKVEDIKKIATSIKSISEKTKAVSKKNTDSADTEKAQFEITESVEKELSKVMEHDDSEGQFKSKSISVVKETSSQNNKAQILKPVTNPDNNDYLNDLDIFESGSVIESNVHLLKNNEHAPSEILVNTIQTKPKTQKLIQKRDRNSNGDDILPDSKKSKLNNNKRFAMNETVESVTLKHIQPDSEPMNYESIMGKVFANIDADIEEIRQSQRVDKNTYNLTNNDKETQNNKVKGTQKEVTMSETNKIDCSINLIDNCNQKDSENIFSVGVEKSDAHVEATFNDKLPLSLPQPNVEDFLTPVLCGNLEPTSEALVADKDIEIVNDDSDKSIVEETPQKSTSFSKMKQKSNRTNKDTLQSQTLDPSKQRGQSGKKSEEIIKSIVNLTDTPTEIKQSTDDATVIETLAKRHTMETPLTITKFVDRITHKSTPIARKSLNFDTDNMDIDPEETLCPTNDIAKTTQEKELMSKAFEKTPVTPAVRPLATRNLGLKNKKFCIAGSCLRPAELAELKALCSRYKWTFTDRYTKDLTHLVVGVDQENRSQRSVKYMSALASSKWIISYEWVEKCLQANTVVNEENYEVLDSTGEPGPRRSRIATKKLFQGITFFCMEPFSVLNVDTLKDILEAAGGVVVKEAKEVRVTGKTNAPAILLAEPENTQEDRFIYLAMELGIVPVNFEWVLNCLGNYTLGSIHELLLCPVSLLPKATENWPQELLAQDEDKSFV